jgi:hypothetical protein
VYSSISQVHFISCTVVPSVLNLDTPWPETVRNGTNTARNGMG